MIGVAIVYVTRRKFQDREEIVKAKEYIESHWLEKFSVEEVAKAALMSVAHFERTFKAYTGMTPHAYYIKTKVNRLKEALLNQNKRRRAGVFRMRAALSRLLRTAFQKGNGADALRIPQTCAGADPAYR